VAKRKAKARPARSEARLPHSAHRIPSPPSVFRESVVVAALVAVLLGSALLVDPGAHASFDAPKRFVVLLGTALAAFAAFAFPTRPSGARFSWRALPLPSRVALGALAVAVAWAAISALLSPRRTASIDSFRVVLLYALLLPLGASRAAGRRKGVLFAAFLAAAGANAVISLLQSRGIQPFRLQTFGTRNEVGALAGNVGYLALALSFAAVASLGFALAAKKPVPRALFGVLLVLFLSALVVGRTLTAVLSVAAGGAVLVLALYGRRALTPIAGLFAALLLAVFLYPPLAARAGEALRLVRAGEWDRLTTYRVGAWAAAGEMARERPVVGWGPGTYGAEFVPHRLEAEIGARKRFVNPLVTSSYSEAHNDYLQAFAETGIPGGLAAIVSAGALAVAVARRWKATPGRFPLETAVLLAVLVAGAVAAATWFPLQRPITAVPLLLAAGRSWKLTSEALPERSPQ
jgi:O-antigen ligase